MLSLKVIPKSYCPVILLFLNLNTNLVTGTYLPMINIEQQIFYICQTMTSGKHLWSIIQKQINDKKFFCKHNFLRFKSTILTHPSTDTTEKLSYYFAHVFLICTLIYSTERKLCPMCDLRNRKITYFPFYMKTTISIQIDPPMRQMGSIRYLPISCMFRFLKCN